MDMEDYQAWEKQTLSDIGHDTDALIKMLGEKSMGDSFDSGLLTGMMRNGDGFGNNNLVLILLLLIMGRGGWQGCGDMRDVARESTLINESNYGRLMDALSAQGIRQEGAISQLAQSLNCDIGQVKQALCGVDKAIALSNGDLKSAIQSCCCNVRQEIAQASAKTDLELVRGFGDVKSDIQATRYLVTAQGAAQDAMIAQKFADQNAYLASQFCEIKNREDQREIIALRQALADAKASANKNEILAAIGAPKAVAGTLDTTAGTWAGTVPTP